MSFLRIDSANLAVPGKMDMDEMAFLAALAAMVPDGGRIVEIGPFYGRSTCTMARANPGAHITSIDTFEDAPWTRSYAQGYADIPAFSHTAFAHYTDAFPNVSALTGPSPDVAQDWCEPIDLFFEDAVHGNPVLGQNLSFWSHHLKPGGIACGHDYTRRFPDVKREVDALALKWKTDVAIVGSLWAIRKPPGDLALPALSTTPRLSLHSKNLHAGQHASPDGYWCGAHLEADRLSWVQVDPIAARPDLHLQYRVGHPKHGHSAWIDAGHKAQLIKNGKARPFIQIAMRLRPGAPAQTPLHLGYRVSARQIGRGGHAVSGTSDWAFDGAWTRLHAGSPAINAFCAALFERPPPDAQAAFTPKIASKPARRNMLRRLMGKVSIAAGAAKSL